MSIGRKKARGAKLGGGGREGEGGGGRGSGVPNLDRRVLRFFCQRSVAWRDSGIMAFL